MTNFIDTWTVILVDSSISENLVRGWFNAAGLPSCWKFVFDNNPTGKILAETAYGQVFPAPLIPKSISIYESTNPTYFMSGNVPGISFPWKETCCVARMNGDSDIELGARIWHEMMHSQGVDADAMKTTYKDEFCNYLISTNSQYKDFCNEPNKYDGWVTGHSEILSEFYLFLTKKYFSCECFRDGCAWSNDVQPQSETPSSVLYVENENPVVQPVVTTEPTITTETPATSNSVVDWINKNPALAAGIGLLGLAVLFI